MQSLIDIIKAKVVEPRNDGVLHFSSHLTNPRHTVLGYFYGIPNTTKPWANTLPLLQGSGVHDYIHSLLSKCNELRYMPEKPIHVGKEYEFKHQWSGTADAYVQESSSSDIWLIDYKTISGTSLEFLDGPKREHVLQVSAYYHFGPKFDNMRAGILYLPTGPNYKRQWSEPVFYEIMPLDKDFLLERMREVERSMHLFQMKNILPDVERGEYKWKKIKKDNCWEVSYHPHYSYLFCPWKGEDEDVCGCSTLKVRVVGRVSMTNDYISGDKEELLKANWYPDSVGGFDIDAKV